MPQHRKYLELLLEISDAVLVAEGCLEVGLDCYFPAREEVGGCSDDGVGALCDDSSQAVLLEPVAHKIRLGEAFLVPVSEGVLQRFDAVLPPNQRVPLTYFGETLFFKTAVFAQLDLLEGERVRLIEESQLFVGVSEGSVLGPVERRRKVLVVLADLADVGQAHQLT